MLRQEACKGPWEGEVHEIPHEVSSGDMAQLSVPTSIFRVAALLAWVDRPLSSGPREAEPLAAAKSKNKTNKTKKHQ